MIKPLQLAINVNTGMIIYEIISPDEGLAYLCESFHHVLQ